MELVHDILFFFEFFDVESMENVGHRYNVYVGNSFKKIQNIGTYA